MQRPTPRRPWLAHFLILLVFGLASADARAQSTLLQGGPVTPGHAPMYIQGGAGAQTVVQDSGPAGGGAVGLGLSELLLVKRGTGTPPFANGGSGPFGATDCRYDAPTTNPAGYHYFCFDPNAQGSALIATGAVGSASPQPLCFIVNGLPVCIGGSSGGSAALATATLPTTAGAVSCWTNATGNLTSCALGPATLLGNPNNTGATAAAFTIQGLAARGAPDANNDKIPLYDFASGSIKYVTPGQIATAATAGVASLAGVTGAITIDNSLLMTGSQLSAARARWTGAVSYYVRTDGNDSNSCLVDNAGGACLTVQGAISKVYNNTDTQAFTANIVIRIGNYTTSCNTLTGLLLGAGTLNIIGDPGTPSNVSLSCATTHVFKMIDAQVNLNGLKLATPSGSGSPVFATGAANVTTTNMEYAGSIASDIEAEAGARVFESGPITISAGAVSHWHVNQALGVSTAAYTLTGTPHFSAYYAGLATFGALFTGGATFTGSATGTRCVVHDFGWINASGASGGANFLPGDAPCVVNEMGAYLDEANPSGTYNIIGIYDTSNHQRVVGSTPSISGCGTSPSVTGTDRAGLIVTGTGSPSACAITFAVPYNSIPFCNVTYQSLGATAQYGVSATQITLTYTPANNAFINYSCMAQQGG